MATQIQFGNGMPNTLVFDRGTHIALAPQSAVGTAVMNVNDFSRYRYAVNTLTFNPTSTLLTPNVIPTTIEQFPSVSGPVDLTGSMTMDMVPDRMEILWAQLLNTNQTNIVYANDNSADHTYVAAGASFSLSGTAATVLPRTSGLDKGPQILEVDPTGVTGASSSNPACVVVVGTDINGGLLTETIYITDPSDTVDGLSYFQTVTKVTGAGSAAGSFALKGKASTNRTKGELNSDATTRQSNGLTIEVNYGTPDGNQRGAVTETLTDAFINSFTCTATKAAIATCTWGFTAKGILPGANPLGGKGPMVRTTGGTGPYGAGAFATAQDGQVPFPGSGVALFLENRDGDSIRINQLESFDLSINNSTAFTERTGSVLPGIPYNGVRIGTGSFTMELHSNDTDYVNGYLQNRFIDNGRFEFRQPGNKTNVTAIKVGRLQLSSYPIRTTQGGTYVQHQVNFTMLPSEPTQTTPNPVDSVSIEFIREVAAATVKIGR